MTKKEKSSSKNKPHHNFGARVLYLIAAILNTIVALGLLLSSIAAYISPVQWIIPAYAGLIFIFLLILNLCFLIFWIICRQSWFLLPLATFLLVLGPIRSTIGFHTKTNEVTNEAAHKIKILSYNTMSNAKFVKPTKKKHNEVLDFITETDADIVCLQEFAVSKQAQYLTIGDVLAIMQKYPYRYISYKVDNKYRQMGLATFSKYPIVKKELIKIESRFNLSHYADVVVGSDTLRVFNNHLESNRMTEKDIQTPTDIKNNFDTKAIGEFAGYIEGKLSAAYKIRAKQVDVVAKEIAQSPYKVLCCGDFNDVPVSYTYKTLKGNLIDAFTECGCGMGTTFEESWLHVRIDYILHDKSMEATHFKIDKKTCSDHYPIYCNLIIN